MMPNNKPIKQRHSFSDIRKAFKAIKNREGILKLHLRELQTMEQHLAEKERAIAEKEQAIMEKEQALAKLELVAQERDKAIAEKNIILKDIFKDPLTDCFNRNYFKKLMAENNNVELNHNRIGIVFVDLNNLKKINDTIGHDAGDKFITDVANTLKSNFRHDYDAVIRVGGDEFIVVCFNYRYDGNFGELLEHKMCYIRCQNDLDFAYGVAVFNKNSDRDLNDTKKRADKLMYACKKNDKCCHPTKVVSL